LPITPVAVTLHNKMESWRGNTNTSWMWQDPFTSKPISPFICGVIPFPRLHTSSIGYLPK